MARTAGTLDIYFNNLSISVNLYVAAVEEKVSFKNLSPAGNLAKSVILTEEKKDDVRLMDSVTGDKFNKLDAISGIEVGKNKYIPLSDDDLSKLSCTKKDGIYISKCVKVGTIDPLQFNSAYYIEPEVISSEPFSLLASQLNKKKLIAFGTKVQKGKDVNVVLRPYNGSLILQTLFRNDEIREMPVVNKIGSSKENEELISKAIDKMFIEDVEHLLDGESDYNLRVLTFAREKAISSAGITLALKGKSKKK